MAKPLNAILLIHNEPITKPTTSKYLKQKQPSLMAMDNRDRQSITRNISPNSINRQRDSLNMADGPIHPNLDKLMVTDLLRLGGNLSIGQNNPRRRSIDSKRRRQISLGPQKQ